MPRTKSKKKGAALRARTTADVQVTTSAIREYETALCRALQVPVSLFFTKLFKKAEADYCNANGKDASPAQIARNFQETLRAIPTWSQDRIERVTQSIKRKSTIRSLQDVLSAVVTQRVMLLCSVRTQDQVSLEVEIAEPTLSSYVHKVLIHAAKALYRYPSLLMITDDTTERDLYSRQRTFDEIVAAAIKAATNECVPIDSLVGTYLEDAMGAREFEVRRDKDDRLERHGARKASRVRVGADDDDTDSILGDMPSMEIEKVTRPNTVNEEGENDNDEDDSEVECTENEEMETSDEDEDENEDEDEEEEEDTEEESESGSGTDIASDSEDDDE